MSEELKPCPFCGSPAEEYPDGDMEGFSILCSGKRPFVMFDGTKEHCPLSTFGYESREASIAAWNTRENSELSALRARLEKLEEVLKNPTASMVKAGFDSIQYEVSDPYSHIGETVWKAMAEQLFKDQSK